MFTFCGEKVVLVQRNPLPLLKFYLFVECGVVFRICISFHADPDPGWIPKMKKNNYTQKF